MIIIEIFRQNFPPRKYKVPAVPRKGDTMSLIDMVSGQTIAATYIVTEVLFSPIISIVEEETLAISVFLDDLIKQQLKTGNDAAKEAVAKRGYKVDSRLLS